VDVERAAEDVVHFDAEGEVTVAYPFSGRTTAHHVTLNGRSVYAMCAIDALGMALMSSNPSRSVRATRLRTRESASDSARTAWPPGNHEGRSSSSDVPAKARPSRGCCQVLNFFASPASAERYLRERNDVRGHVISLPDAIEVGRCVFGDVLTPIRPAA